MKIKTWHVVIFILLIGLGIYVFSKQDVHGTVTADESDAVITRRGTISYGTETK